MSKTLKLKVSAPYLRWGDNSDSTSAKTSWRVSRLKKVCALLRLVGYLENLSSWFLFQIKKVLFASRLFGFG